VKLPLSPFFRLAGPSFDLTIFDSGLFCFSFLGIEHPDVGAAIRIAYSAGSTLRFHTSHPMEVSYFTLVTSRRTSWGGGAQSCTGQPYRHPAPHLSGTCKVTIRNSTSILLTDTSSFLL
jgi:hypothetical protein